MRYHIVSFLLSAAVLLSAPQTTVFAAANNSQSMSVYSDTEAESVMEPILISYRLYSDVDNHWSKDAVSFLAENDAILFEGDNFSPYRSITRGEFAYMLAKALNIHMEYFVAPDPADYFDDLSADDPYTSQVINLVTAGVFISGGDFNGEETISREEMVHYVIKAYQYLLGDDYPDMSIMMLPTFDDAELITPAYNDDIARAQQMGLIKGKNNLFCPVNNTSRGDAAIVLYRLSGLLADESSEVNVTPEAVLTKDGIQVTITVSNPNAYAVSLNSTSGQLFDYALLDSEQNTLYFWSADKMFMQMLMSTEIAGNDELVFTNTLSGDMFTAIKDKITGLRAYVTATDDFIDHDGYYIDVK